MSHCGGHGIALRVLHDDLGGRAVGELGEGDDLVGRQRGPETEADGERSWYGNDHRIGVQHGVVRLHPNCGSAPVDRADTLTEAHVEVFGDALREQVVATDDPVGVAAMAELTGELSRVGMA